MTDFEKDMDVLCLPSDARKTILKCFNAKPSVFLVMADKAYEGELCDLPICKRKPEERLVIWCCLVPRIVEKYRKADTPNTIIMQMLWEITRLAAEYEKRTGKIGLSKENVIWLRHIYHANIFTFGSLQFQRFNMVYLDEEGCGEEYMTFSRMQKEKIPPGSPVINVHIPTGTDLSPSAVENSFAEAEKFFVLKESSCCPLAFTCYSWLLYPGMQELLPLDCNIRNFAARFQIIGQVSDPYGSEAVRRIYGRRYPAKRDYPTQTQLQRNAIGHFSKLGMACGIIEIT